MGIRGVTYNDDNAVGERLNLLALIDLDTRYTTPTDVVFGNTEGTYTEGNDPRLSDQRTPLDGSVTNAKVATDAIGTLELQNNAVTNAKMADNSVGTSELIDDSVTIDKLADDSVGIPQIAATGTPTDTSFLRGDGSWAEGTTGVGDGAVTTAKIADNSVTLAKMADDSVGVAELSATGTPGTGTFLRGDNTWAAIPAFPYDVYYMAFSDLSPRVVGAGDNTMGIKLQRAVTFTSITYRGATADASGNLVVELRKNGVAVSGTSKTIAAADQTAGGANATITGSWAFAAGDILTVYITSVGTTPGKGLVADITGTSS